MSQLNHGDALWQPAPLPYFKRIQPGDVGYIRRGCFHLLFSAGCPLDGRRRGIDVPRTFKPLDVGLIFGIQPRSPGYLTTNTVRETPARPKASIYPMLEPGSSISFQLTGDQGAALLTKHPTYTEDTQQEQAFEEYTKEHYDSWVTFARERKHGNDIKPVLATGVDMTRDFAMMTYSNNDDDLTAEFTLSAPGVASWGRWRTRGAVYTNCGPQQCRPPAPAQTADLTPSDNSHTETISDEYNQCVFVRYYTVRKRLGIPRVIRAGAGPHDVGAGGHDNEETLLEVQYNSDSDSDTLSSLFDDDDDDDDRSSVTSIDSEDDTVVHNTTPDERDDFDAIADYVFQNSDADSVLLHHRDIALLREPGDSTDLSTQLIEKRPQILVDRDGVGTIGRKTDPPAKTWFDDSLGIVPHASVSIPSEIEREAMDRIASREPRPSSRPEYPPQGGLGWIEEVITNAGGSVFEAAPLVHNNPTVGQFHPKGLLATTALCRNHDFDDRNAPKFSDSDGTHRPYPTAMESQAVTPPPLNWHKLPQQRRYERPSQHFSPSEFISFSANGRSGVNIGGNLGKRFAGLDGRDDLVLWGTGEGARRVDVSCNAGILAGRTIRAEVNEIQKANVGRKYAALKARRALDPPPVKELRIYDVRDTGSSISHETEVIYRGLQPTNLICYVEAFHVSMAIEENPAQVTDFPVLPSANPSYPPVTRNGQPVEIYWRDQPITAAANYTSSLVGDMFTQALNLPIGPNGKHSFVFVFADLSVQLKGWFLFRYRMFDVNSGSHPILAECWGRPFRIYATRQFPRLEPPTEFTTLLHSHHVPVRAREVRRKRKNSDNDSGADAVQDQSTTP